MSPMRRYVDLSAEELHLGAAGVALARGAGGLGVLGLLASGFLASSAGAEGMASLWRSYLLSFCFFLSLSLGALFFVLLQHLTRAGWSVVVRRLAEGFAANFGLLAVLFLPLLLGLGTLYEWTDPARMAHEPLLSGKRAYLSVPFFVTRMGLYFLSWLVLSRWFFARSVEQDSSGDPQLTTRMRRASTWGMILFALTLTFASFDLLMSLEPLWYSTIFGVYFFSGSVLAFFALLAVAAYLVQRSGRLTRSISVEHYHDLGKFIFAFVIFWGYIAFSQYMLIWYANIPEETVWYLSRQEGQWEGWSWLLLFGHFLVPFLALISRIPKRRPATLAAIAAWVLLMHWVDLYYISMPYASPGQVPLHIQNLTCFLGIGGLYVASFANRMRKCSLIPLRDPHLAESLAFENP